jgi:hypothetical protein
VEHWPKATGRPGSSSRQRVGMTRILLASLDPVMGDVDR